MKTTDKKQKSLDKLELSPWQKALLDLSYGRKATTYQKERLHRFGYLNGDLITLTHKGHQTANALNTIKAFI